MSDVPNPVPSAISAAIDRLRERSIRPTTSFVSMNSASRSMQSSLLDDGLLEKVKACLMGCSEHASEQLGGPQNWPTTETTCSLRGIYDDKSDISMHWRLEATVSDARVQTLLSSLS